MAEGRGARRRNPSGVLAWVVLGGALAGLLAACGGEEVGAKPDLPTETPALWNPCDALDAAFVQAQFGAVTTEHAGTPTSPECRFTPVAEQSDGGAGGGAGGGADGGAGGDGGKGSGDPVVTANYLLFPGTLDAAWETMGQQPDADVRHPAVAGADDARIVVSNTDEQLYVTGFVQNGDLIQQVDVVDPAPYDEARAVRGVRATLAALSAHAEAAAAADEAAADPSATD